jgi:hypothetical protein
VTDNGQTLSDLRTALDHAARTLAAPNDEPGTPARLRAVLVEIEAATPHGAPLHSRLDNVRRWLTALENPDDHHRFGGAEHLREHLASQIRVAIAALDEYARASSA